MKEVLKSSLPNIIHDQTFEDGQQVREGSGIPILHKGEVRAYNDEESYINIWLLGENGALQLEEYGIPVVAFR